MIMHHHMNLTLRACVTTVVAILSFAAGDANAQGFQWPDEPENLQVLPDDVTGRKLGGVMRGFASSLGVRCEHCHVGEGSDLSEFDFVSDEKPTKLKARLMLQMVDAINQEHLSQLADIEVGSSPALEVTCMTCHRKQARPVMLQDILTSKVGDDGIDAAEAKYRELREQYYGGFSFDFGPGALTSLGEQFGDAGDFASGIRFIELEIEMNGESASVYYTLGGIQASAKMTTDAIESFTRGLAMAPDGWKPFFQKELDLLTAEED